MGTRVLRACLQLLPPPVLKGSIVIFIITLTRRTSGALGADAVVHVVQHDTVVMIMRSPSMRSPNCSHGTMQTNRPKTQWPAMHPTHPQTRVHHQTPAMENPCTSFMMKSVSPKAHPQLCAPVGPHHTCDGRKGAHNECAARKR